MSDKTIHIDDHDSEADTCRKEVLPKLYDSQWTDELILEQRTFTDGKIIVIGRKARRKKAKRFLLFLCCVVLCCVVLCCVVLCRHMGLAVRADTSA
jgi:type I site-specific restriction endonuclease